MRRNVMFWAAIGWIVLSNVSLANLTFFTDRTAWENAISGDIVTETFNTVTPYNFSEGTNAAGLLTVELLNISTTNEFNSIDNSLTSPVKVDQTTHLRGACLRNDTNAKINLQLPYSVKAFGGDFVSTHSTDGLFLEIVGMQYAFAQLIPSDGFLGIISSNAFSAITLFDPIQDDPDNKIFRLGESFGLDNVSFAEVPEPATLGLLGLGGLCLFLKKRRLR